MRQLKKHSDGQRYEVGEEEEEEEEEFMDRFEVDFNRPLPEESKPLSVSGSFMLLLLRLDRALPMSSSICLAMSSSISKSLPFHMWPSIDWYELCRRVRDGSSSSNPCPPSPLSPLSPLSPPPSPLLLPLLLLHSQRSSKWHDSSR